MNTAKGKAEHHGRRAKVSVRCGSDSLDTLLFVYGVKFTQAMLTRASLLPLL